MTPEKKLNRLEIPRKRHRELDTTSKESIVCTLMYRNLNLVSCN